MVCLLEFRSTIEGTLLDYKTILKKFQFENRTLYFIFNMLFFLGLHTSFGIERSDSTIIYGLHLFW